MTLTENWLTSLDDMKVYDTGGVDNVVIQNNSGGEPAPPFSEAKKEGTDGRFLSLPHSWVDILPEPDRETVCWSAVIQERGRKHPARESCTPSPATHYGCLLCCANGKIYVSRLPDSRGVSRLCRLVINERIMRKNRVPFLVVQWF